MSVSDVVSKSTTFVFMLAAARHLGADLFGTFSFGLAFVSMFVVLSDLGLGQLAVRDIARDHQVARRFLSSALAIKLVALTLVIGIVVLLANVLGYSRSAVRAVCICSLVIGESAFTLFYRSVFQAYERTVFVVVSRLAQIVVVVVGLVVLSKRTPTVEGYAWLFVGSSMSTAVLSWALASLFLVRPSLDFDFRYWRKLLTDAAPIAFAALLIAFYYWNGSTWLAKVKGDSAVGVYSAAMRLVLGLGFLSSAFAGAMYPLMSKVFSTEPQRLAQVLERSLRYVSLVGIPIGVLGTTLAGPVVAFLYGRGYAQSVPVLQLLVWWCALMYLTCMMGNYFLSVDCSRVVTIQASLSLLTNVLLNVLLVPPFGARGAALSLVAAELVGLGFFIHTQIRTSMRVDARALAKSLLLGLVAAVLAAPIAWFAARWHVLTGLVVGLAAYSILLFLFRAVDAADAAALWSMLRAKS